MDTSEIKNIYPLAPMQEGLLFHALAEPESAAYFEQIGYRLTGDLDRDCFGAAWQELVRRHDVLRTVFVHENTDRVLQVVLKSCEARVSYEDLSGLGVEAQAERIARFKAEDRACLFDLRRGPLMRWRLFRLGARLHEVVWSHHHILLDGWSIGVIQREFGEVYRSLALDQFARLKPPVPYSRFIKWVEGRATGEAEAFWKRRLAGYAVPARIPEWRRPGDGAGKSEMFFTLPEPVATGVTRIAARHQVTASTVMQCAWAVLLARYNHVEDVVFGSVVSGRPAEIPGIERVVGLCVNTVPVRVQPKARATFADLLRSAQAEALLSEPHHWFPLVRIQASSEPREKLIGTHFAFENFPMAENSLPPDAAVESGELRVGAVSVFEQTHYDFDIQITPGREWRVRLAYRPGLYHSEQVEKLWGHLARILESVIADDRVRIGEIPLLSRGEEEALIAEGRAEAAPADDSVTLVEWFETQAARCAENVSLRCDGEQLTYAELNERANRLARRLRSLGAGVEKVVGLCLDRSIDMVVAILATLKAGAGYLPMEPSHPKDRLAFMVSDAGLEWVITRSDLAAVLPEGVRCVFTDALDRTPEDSDGANLGVRLHPDQVAYVIYTSGSTGQPKGVQVTHRNVTRLFEQTRHWFGFGAEDVWTLFHSYAFDFSVWEIWGALLYGGRLVVVPYWTSRSPEEFLRLLSIERVTVLNQTPSAFRQLMLAEAERRDAVPLALRYVIFGGEALEFRSLKPWFDRHDQRGPKLINMYGITETTVHVTFRPVTSADADAASSVIGRPIPDLSLHILDGSMRPVPMGVAGEMYVGGGGLAPGYLARPDLTAERFVADPFSQAPGGRLYRTGDIARRLPGGEIEYLGRIDSQVKIRGFRIELGEIESALASHPDVRESVVIFHKPAQDRGELAAYVVARGAAEGLERTLRDYLARRLPDYMVPAVIMMIASVPLTSNGKLDRLSLPSPDHRTRDDDYVPPRSGIESALVEIWADRLGRDRVGITDNYFALGGDSITAIQIVSRASRAGLKVSIADLFRHPTIGELALRVRPVSADTVGTDREGEEFRLSPIQRWFLEQYGDHASHYNHALLLRGVERLNERSVDAAVRAVVSRHASLRLRFSRRGGVWLQQVSPATAMRGVEVVELPGGLDPQAAMREHIACVQGGFDLFAGGLFRAILFRGPECDWLFLVAHHLTVDGVSWRILMEDLAEAYRVGLRQELVQLPTVPASYRAWVEGLARWAESDGARTEVEYWAAEARRTDGTAPVLAAGIHGDEQICTMSFELGRPREWLARANQAYGTTTEDLLLAALGPSICAEFGLDAAWVACEGHGRDGLSGGLDLGRTVGWFTSLFPVQLEAVEAADLGRRIKRVKERMRSIPNRGAGFGVLRRMPPDSPVADAVRRIAPCISLNYLGDLDSPLEGQPWRMESVDLGAAVPAAAPRPFALGIVGMIVGGRLDVSFGYDPSSLGRDRVEGIARGFRDEFLAVIEHCHRKGATELTPSDLTYSKLSLDELEVLFDD